MKYTFLILFVFVSYYVNAQKGYRLHYGLKPNMEYHQTCELKAHSEIKYILDGDSAAIKRGNKIPKPERSDESQKIRAVMLISPMAKDSLMQVLIDVSEISGSDEKNLLQNTLKYTGKCKYLKLPPMDSVRLNGNKEMDKDFLKNVISNLLVEIVFPEHPLKVKEKFYVRTHMSLPQGAGELPVKMEVLTEYRLAGVKNEEAYIEIRAIYQIDLKQLKTVTSISGSGGGKMVFDIKKCYFKTYDMTTKLSFSMKQDNFVAKTETVTTQSQVVQIK